MASASPPDVLTTLDRGVTVNAGYGDRPPVKKAQQNLKGYLNGKAQPFHTSGGEAEAIKAIFARGS